MTAWYFLFEGRFLKEDPKFGLKGVCSSCIVPAEERDTAYEMFVGALSSEGIELTIVEEEFEIDPIDLDEEDSANSRWIGWHDEAWGCNQVLFEPWQVFDPDSEEDNTSD